MRAAFLKLESLRQSLALHAQEHAWDRCFSLTEEMNAALKQLPPAENDSESRVLTDFLAEFANTRESALAEHRDIQKLLSAFQQSTIV